MKFSATAGDQLEYNGSHGVSGDQIKIKLRVLESTTNASIMYMLIQLLKEQLSLIVIQCLFHASTTSDHAQLRPEYDTVLQFCVALAMWHHGIFVYNNENQVKQLCVWNRTAVINTSVLYWIFEDRNDARPLKLK